MRENMEQKNYEYEYFSQPQLLYIILANFQHETDTGKVNVVILNILDSMIMFIFSFFVLEGTLLAKFDLEIKIACLS